MSNFTFTVTWNGAPPHDYYIYTPAKQDETASRLRFHVTVPLTDKVRGRYGSYPHITIEGRRGKKKWVNYETTTHWYLYTGVDGACVAVDSSGKAISLSADEILFRDKVYADMKEYRALPWASNAASKTKSA
jgi:hypothetical protein